MGLGLCLKVEEATGVTTLVLGATGLTLLQGKGCKTCDATKDVGVDVIVCEDVNTAAGFGCWSLGLIQGNPATGGVFKLVADVGTTGVWNKAGKM